MKNCLSLSRTVFPRADCLLELLTKLWSTTTRCWASPTSRSARGFLKTNSYTNFVKTIDDAYNIWTMAYHWPLGTGFLHFKKLCRWQAVDMVRMVFRFLVLSRFSTPKDWARWPKRTQPPSWTGSACSWTVSGQVSARGRHMAWAPAGWEGTRRPPRRSTGLCQSPRKVGNFVSKKINLGLK